MNAKKLKNPANSMISRVLMLPKWHFVGVAGFEPATSASQTRRDNRATLHPDNECISTSVENKKTTGTKFLCLYYVSAISRRLLRRDRDSNPGYLFLGTTI